MATGFTNNGVEATSTLVPKAWLLDRYPELVNTYQKSGLWTWGYNPYGEIGDNTVATKSSPVQTVSGGSNWKSIASSHYFSFAVKTDGTLWGWGFNNNGQLANNTASSTSKYSSPIQTIAGGTNWKQVSGGYAHIGAIKTDGTLWMWGRNNYGQIGDNGVVSKSSPVQTVSGGTNWKQVSCAVGHTHAIKSDGTLWGWGLNTNSQLGLTIDNNNRSSPTQITGGGITWRVVSAGSNGSGAIKSDGTLWMWGVNSYGTLGRNNTTQTNSPAQTVSGGTTWKQISCCKGQTKYTTAAIKTDGTLWMWGDNSLGQLGDNSTVTKSSPVQTVAGGTNWYQVSNDQYVTGAIKTDGTLWMWGNGTLGALGDNTLVNKSSPVQIAVGSNNWKYIKAGYHSMAIRDDPYDLGSGTL